MNHSLDVSLRECLSQEISVRETRVDKFRTRNHRTAMTFGEIVVHDDLVAVADQLLSHYAADVSGASSNKHAHTLTPFGKRPIQVAGGRNYYEGANGIGIEFQVTATFGCVATLSLCTESDGT